MAIQLIHIGRNNKNLYHEAEDEFNKRIKRYSKFVSISIPPSKKAKSLPKVDLLKMEAESILKKIKPLSYIILLDENGVEMNSRTFASYIQKKMAQNSDICFIIGGAYGFSESLKVKSNDRISLSKMTFPHHLARSVFLEQLYRAFSIINNEPYHND